MDPNFKASEREVIRLINFFKRRIKRLVAENKTIQDYGPMLETCDKLVEQINIHARNRDTVLKEREQLKGLIKENASCPKCEKNINLKLIGTDKSSEGWKSNKYRCKKCNIEFVWKAPNNPWDMVPYVEQFVANLELKLQLEDIDEETKEYNLLAIEQFKSNLSQLKPVVEASDLDLAELVNRDKEMDEIIGKFKKHLMIEKILMED